MGEKTLLTESIDVEVQMTFICRISIVELQTTLFTGIIERRSQEDIENSDKRRANGNFFNPHSRSVFSLILEREEGREKHRLVASHTHPDQGS